MNGCVLIGEDDSRDMTAAPGHIATDSILYDTACGRDGQENIMYNLILVYEVGTQSTEYEDKKTLIKLKYHAEIRNIIKMMSLIISLNS